MTYTLAVANQKGGVAKTTTAVNVADLAASRGLRVLLVDVDPQGNASTLTDAEPKTSDANAFGKPQRLTVADALYFAQERPGAAVQVGTVLAVAVPAGEHWPDLLHVAPANDDLAFRADETFAGAERRLAVGLTGADELYDLVVIDCPPTLGMLALNAMHAADGVLLVTEPADNSLAALPRSVETLRTVRQARDDSDRPDLLGVLATNVPAQEGRARELMTHLQQEYGDLVWGSVPRRSVVRHAEAAHAPLRAFGADARDVVDVYAHVTDQLLARLELVTTGAV